jgi:hypothetical protein
MLDLYPMERDVIGCRSQLTTGGKNSPMPRSMASDAFASTDPTMVSTGRAYTDLNYFGKKEIIDFDSCYKYDKHS